MSTAVPIAWGSGWASMAGWTCATCGVFVSMETPHECPGMQFSAADAKTVTHPSGYQTLEPGHEHVWTVASTALEGEYGKILWVRVAYLLCQCGVVKRVRVEL